MACGPVAAPCAAALTLAPLLLRLAQMQNNQGGEGPATPNQEELFLRCYATYLAGEKVQEGRVRPGCWWLTPDPRVLLMSLVLMMARATPN